MRHKHSTVHQRNTPSGFVLISVLISTMFVLAAGIATAQLAASNYRASNVERYRLGTQFAVDAGIDSAMQQINGNHAWTGTGGEVTILQNSELKTTYHAVVTDDPGDTLRKYITVTGRTYVPASAGSPRIERTYTVALRGISAGSFSVVTGVGGLTMTNNSKILGGNLFVNGSIAMTNSAQIGLASSPIDVRVAHATCPAGGGSDYPRVCASAENGEPINITGTARIYGEVIATNQTNGARMSSPGLVSGSVTPSALPEHDRVAQTAAVATTENGGDASCNSGTETWPANLKIEGNVSITGTCRVTVQGDVWITGTFEMRNTAQLIVASAITTPPVIMIDGQNGFDASNGAKLASNSSAVGFRIITYWSSASCSPECTEVTGQDLYNSRNTTTIRLDNSAEGPNTEFYARWSQVELSNGGNIGALVGQTVLLSNSAAVTFGAEVTGIGGVSAWIIDSYKRGD